MSQEPTIDRREFLRSLARGVALGALALGGGWLVSRSDRRCFYGYACAACPAYGDCNSPEREGVAQAAKPASDTGKAQAWQPALPRGER